MTTTVKGKEDLKDKCRFEGNPILTIGETKVLISNFIKTRRPHGAVEEEISALIDKLADWKLHGEMFQMALSGECTIDWCHKSADVIFDLPKNN